jgi:hypothetical protein
MYTDFLNDPKMIALAFEDQRHFIGILALKSDGAIDDTADENLLNRIVAQRLWIDHGIIRDVKKRLKEAGLIDGDWQPVAWNKRQFVSDRDSTATERKRRERAAKAPNSNVTDLSRVTDRDSHKLVTRLDTDTEADTDKEEANASVARSSLPTCPTSSIVDLYHEVLPELPVVRLLGAPRKRAISSFWKFVLTSKRSDGTVRATDTATALEWTRAYFERTRSNDFLMGRGQKAQGHEGWACSIDFLMSEKGRIQVIEKTKDSV